MQRHGIIIGGRRYVLAPGQDRDALEAAAIAAVRSGGDLLRFITAGERRMAVLISPGVSVTFESEDIDAGDEEEGDIAFSSDHLDYGLPDSF